MSRLNCIVCDYSQLDTFLSYKMPILMGTQPTATPDVHIDDMVFDSCSRCGNLQLKNLIELEILYQNNHNVDVVGETWRNHYKEFSKFIEDHILDKTILEISDPSAKIAKLLDNYRSWIIVEPNPAMEAQGKISFIKNFFNENLPLPEKVDAIVHSHLLEHIYKPLEFLGTCSNLLAEDGQMFFSVPNLDYLLKEDTAPNSILHFEHTYFFDVDILKFILSKMNFEIVNSYRYKNHSLFLHVKKRMNVAEATLPLNLERKDIFLAGYRHHIKKIEEINKAIQKSKSRVFLYGAHVFSQFYLYNHLSAEKIDCILDGSRNKESKFLYGTNLRIQDPSRIKDEPSPIIICSHMGIYFEEIKERLLSLNLSAILL